MLEARSKLLKKLQNKIYVLYCPQTKTCLWFPDFKDGNKHKVLALRTLEDVQRLLETYGILLHNYIVIDEFYKSTRHVMYNTSHLR